MLMCSYTIVPMPFGASKGPKGFPHFVLVTFVDKNFNYIENNANILHLKSGDSGRLNYFSTFTPSGYNPPHHDQPITSG
jgi:hypothetical protein